MANPARNPRDVDPTITPDPFNPLPPVATDPVEERYANANDPRVVQNRVDVQAERRTGTSVLIAAVVLIIALVAYLIFASSPDPATVAPEGPAATAPADPAAPAEPDAMAPADTGATNSIVPADPVEPAEPNAMVPADPAPEPAAPAETAPVEPATPAPAQ